MREKGGIMKTFSSLRYRSLVIILLLILPASSFAGWVQIQSPAPGKSLYGVWGSSASDVFAVGEGGTIIHYDGTSWSQMPGATTQKLYGVWGSAGDDVFASGADGTIIHYDGASWTTMESGTKVPLNGGVWGSGKNDVFVSGEGGIILHYDGESWQPMTSGTTVSLGGGIWGTSGTDVLCAGAAVLHYDGATWSSVPAVTAKFLSGIWGSSAHDIFAVGAGGTILHYDNASWTAMTSGSSGWLDGVWGSSASDVFAVGYDNKNGVILHYDGTAWSSMKSNTAYSLYGVWGTSAGNVFVVGERATILHYDGNPSPPSLCPAQMALGAAHPALEELRCLRDRMLAEHGGAGKYVALYYRHSREAVAIMHEHPELTSFFRELVFELPGITEDKEESGDMLIEKAYADKILLFMDALAVYASPQLKKDLQSSKDTISSFIFISK